MRSLTIRTIHRIFLRLLIAIVGAGTFQSVNAAAPALLPDGSLSVRGSQLIGYDGRRVRIACVGLTGMNVIGGRLKLAGPFTGIDGHVAAMKNVRRRGA